MFFGNYSTIFSMGFLVDELFLLGASMCAFLLHQIKQMHWGWTKINLNKMLMYFITRLVCEKEMCAPEVISFFNELMVSTKSNSMYEDQFWV